MIPATLHDELAAISGAVTTERGIAAGVIFTHGSVKVAITLVGYNPQTGVGGLWKFAEGRGVQAKSEVVLDAQLAQESRLALGDKVDLLGRTFTVVGLSRETNSWQRCHSQIHQVGGITGLEGQMKLRGFRSRKLLQVADQALQTISFSLHYLESLWRRRNHPILQTFHVPFDAG